MNYKIRRLEEQILDIEALSLTDALDQAKQGPHLSGGELTVHLLESEPGTITIYQLYTCDSLRTPLSYRPIAISANRETIHNVILEELGMDYPASERNDLAELYGDLVGAVIEEQIPCIDIAEYVLDLKTLDIK